MIRRAAAHIAQKFAIASVVGLLLVAPLAFLEFKYATGSRQSLDYAALFGLMWLLPVAFVMIAAPVLHKFRAGHTLHRPPVVLGIKLVLLIFLAGIWIAIVRDQLPCFIGVPNCD